MLRVIKSDDSDLFNELKFNVLVLILLNYYLNIGLVFIIYFKMIVIISKIVLREYFVFVFMFVFYGSVESNL